MTSFVFWRNNTVLYCTVSWCVHNRMSHTAYRKGILIIFTKQTRLKNTGMKNGFQPVCLHFSTDFSTDESEPLDYLTVTSNFNYKESDLTISLNQPRVVTGVYLRSVDKLTVMISIKTNSVKNHILLTVIFELFL